MPVQSFRLRFSAAYALMMLGMGVQLPFLPLWLAAKGLSVSEISLIVAGMMAVRVVGAPLFAWAADHWHMRQAVIRGCTVLAFIAYATMAMLDGFWPIAAAALLAGFLFAPVFPLAEGFSVDASAALGIDYGQLRLWASLSFLAGSLMSGALLTSLDPLDAALLLAGAQGLSVVAVFLLPPEPLGLKAVRQDGDMSALRALFLSRFAGFMVVAGLAQASHGALYSVSSLHWQALGFDTLAIGLFWTAAVLVEVAMFSRSNALVQRFGPANLFLCGVAGGLVRWIGMAHAESFLAILALQAMHVLSFAVTHLATMHLIRQLVPAHVRNRAQGLNAAIASGVLMAGSSWIAGHIYSAMGGQVYLAMASLSAIALAGALVLFRVSPRGQHLAGA